MLKRVLMCPRRQRRTALGQSLNTCFALQNRIDEVNSALTDSKLPFGAHSDQLKGLDNYPFREDPAESKVFWDVRKGLIPIVGGGREAGECSTISVSPPIASAQQDSMVQLHSSCQ